MPVKVSRLLFVLLSFVPLHAFAQGGSAQIANNSARGFAGDQSATLKFTDKRDSQEYKTVKIGSQVWMAENLSFAAEESWCYTRFNYDCRKYGRFYTWDVAKDVCPDGWHLPTSAEFEQLIDAVGGRDSAGVKLKSAEGWSHYSNGTDDFGFNATPSGFRDYRGRFDRQTMYAYLWSSTEDGVGEAGASQDGAAGTSQGESAATAPQNSAEKKAPSKKAIGIHMMFGRNDVSVYPYAKNFGLSVRCVKDE